MIVKSIEIKIVPEGADDLEADFIVGQSRDFSPKGRIDEASLRAAYRKIFQEARRRRSRTLAVPVLGMADKKFPPVGAAKILAQEILRICRDGCGVLRKITAVAPTARMFSLTEQQVYGYLRHVVEDMGWGPYVTVDAIIEVKNGIVLIERSNPPYGWALPGGFVDYGESLETAVRREAKEETNLELTDLCQFHIYSHPGRDPRFHTISAVFAAKGKGTPRSGDDAKNLKVIPVGDVLKHEYAFDHKHVITDYLKTRKGK